MQYALPYRHIAGLGRYDYHGDGGGGGVPVTAAITAAAGLLLLRLVLPLCGNGYYIRQRNDLVALLCESKGLALTGLIQRGITFRLCYLPPCKLLTGRGGKGAFGEDESIILVKVCAGHYAAAIAGQELDFGDSPLGVVGTGSRRICALTIGICPSDWLHRCG